MKIISKPVFVVAVFLILFLAQGAAAQIYSTTNVTKISPDNAGGIPLIYGDKVLWAAGDMVYLYNMTTDSRSIIFDSRSLIGTSASGQNGDSSVYTIGGGGIEERIPLIVNEGKMTFAVSAWGYFGADNSASFEYVFVCNLDEAVPKVERAYFRQDDSYIGETFFSGGKLYWFGGAAMGDSIQYGIIEQGQSMLLVTDRAYPLAVSGNRVVWMDTQRNVILYEIGGKPKILLSGSGLMGGPQISGDNIAWPYNFIYLYNITTGTKQISVDGEAGILAIDGNRIAYVDRSTWNVYLCDAGAGYIEQISEGGGADYPAIDGNAVAWKANGNVYLARIGYQPDPNGFSFCNFDGPREHSVSDFYSTYGFNADSDNAYLRNILFYQQFFRNEGFGGNCFGMSAGTLDLYCNGMDNAFSYASTDPVPDGVSGYARYGYRPADIQEWAFYYQPLQFTEACIGDRISNAAYQDASGALVNLPVVYDMLKQRIGNDWRTDPMVLGVCGYVFNSTTGSYEKAGHAVVPYRIEESPDGQSANIFVYDSNNDPPGNPGSVITFDLASGQVADYGDITNIFRVDLTSWSAIKQTPRIPSWLSSNMLDVSHLLYTDSSGRKLGYDQGVFKQEIPGACPLIPAGAETGAGSLESYYVPDPSIKMELYGTASGDSETSIITPNGAIIAYVPVTATSVDEFKILDEGRGVEFRAESGNVPSLSLVLDVETADSAQVARINVSQIEAGGAIDLANNNGVISVRNYGQECTFGLLLEQEGANANSDDSINDIVLEEDSSVYVKPADWDSLGSGTVEYDVGSDGSIDSVQPIGQSVLPIIPMANFIANVSQGSAPLPVLFTDKSENATGIEWFINGISFGSAASLEHLFEIPGIYNVTLVAGNDNGTSSMEMDVNVTMQAAQTEKPIANFTAVNNKGSAPLLVLFNDTSKNDPTSWTWDFGDKTSKSIEKNTTHIYTKPGKYTVTLTVNNTAGTDMKVVKKCVEVRKK